MKLTLGTRTSNLAMWQTHHIRSLLEAAWPDLVCEIRPYTTKGDLNLDQPLPKIGGKGLFTAELERALIDKEIDLAVHSLKDLPVTQSDGITLGAIAARADVRDVLVAKEAHKMGSLPFGALIGTSSLRRQAQLLEMRPDLHIRSIRGNVETRINKVLDGPYDATILALAGLTRLNLTAHISQMLPLKVMLPAPGQGALAVQCRADDSDSLALLEVIHENDLAACVTAERTFLHGLDGGCSTPVAAYGQIRNGLIQLQGLVGAINGVTMIRVKTSGKNGQAVGRTLAEMARARGALDILKQNEALSQ